MLNSATKPDCDDELKQRRMAMSNVGNEGITGACASPLVSQIAGPTPEDAIYSVDILYALPDMSKVLFALQKYVKGLFALTKYVKGSICPPKICQRLFYATCLHNP
jgi:hypothetical protein